MQRGGDELWTLPAEVQVQVPAHIRTQQSEGTEARPEHALQPATGPPLYGGNTQDRREGRLRM